MENKISEVALVSSGHYRLPKCLNNLGFSHISNAPIRCLFEYFLEKMCYGDSCGELAHGELFYERRDAISFTGLDRAALRRAEVKLVEIGLISEIVKAKGSFPGSSAVFKVSVNFPHVYCGKMQKIDGNVEQKKEIVQEEPQKEIIEAPQIIHEKPKKQRKKKDVNKWTYHIEAIIDHFNEVTGQKRKYETFAKMIEKHLEKGYCIRDFAAVIYAQTKKWKNDEKMREFIRPQTYFSGNFEKYVSDELHARNIAGDVSNGEKEWFTAVWLLERHQKWYLETEKTGFTKDDEERRLYALECIEKLKQFNTEDYEGDEKWQNIKKTLQLQTH